MTPAQEPVFSAYQFGPFVMALAEHRLYREGEVVTLPPKEFELLLLLVRNAGQVMERDRGLEGVAVRHATRCDAQATQLGSLLLRRAPTLRPLPRSFGQRTQQQHRILGLLAAHVDMQPGAIRISRSANSG